jgi:hypothetical protein
MRQLYNKKPKYLEITQGSIITGCIASKYDGCQVWGCIITARCDLSNKKVGMVHYLPIVNFDDFLRKEIVDELKEECIEELKTNLGNRMKEKGVSPSFLDRNLGHDDFETLIRANFKKKKEADNFLDDYEKYLKAPNSAIKDVLSDSKGVGKLKREIDRLVNNDNTNYHLIEDWLCDKSEGQFFRVILLREIKEMSLNCALSLPDGLLETDISSDFLTRNSLSVSLDKSNFYYVDSEIASPYIEHILQRFSNNFIRIGVEDLPKAQVSKQLVEYSKTILI